MSNINTVVTEYFTAFCNKDLAKLSELYDDDVTLNEWYTNIFEGKQAVLDANKQLFDQFDKIEIQVLTSAVVDNKSVNEIFVKLDNTMVDVVDIIIVDDNKISYIMAYRGF